MIDTVLRVVRSDGAEMVFDGYWRGGWAVQKDGLDEFLDLPLEVEMSANVLTDGSSLISKRVGSPERTASVVFAGQDLATARNEALSFFNPKHSFECHVTHMGRTRWCSGELVAVDFPLVKGTYPVTGSFTIQCQDPWMKSEDGNFNSLTDAKPMFGFPFVSHVKETLPKGEKYPVGFNASILIYDGLNTVYNSGDVEANYVIHCEFDGPAKNPTFTKDDRHVQVVTQFKAGDVLDIDFTAAPPTVEINGQNAIQLCSRDSDFVQMAMQVGPNVFQYTCEDVSNRPNMDVQIRFFKNYLGV